jgi:integrase
MGVPAMSFKRVKKFQGVVYYESKTRRYQGKVDRCWYIEYAHYGKNQREKIGWDSEGYNAELAHQIRNDRIKAIRHGKELPRRQVTFAAVWQKYFGLIETQVKHPESKQSIYRNYLHDALGHKPLDKISPLDLERIQSGMTKRGLSPQTVKHAFGLFRAIWNKAAAWGLTITPSPLLRVKIPSVSNRRERFLSPDEARALLTALKKRSATVHDMALLALHTGMRYGEIAKLRWADINLENETITILDNEGKPGGTVYLTAEALAMLKGRQGVGREVFVASKAISKTFTRVVDSLGMNKGVDDRRQKVTFHTLRHTFASWLAIQGTPILTIKELMHHKTLSMTERYAKLIPSSKQRAVKTLPSLVAQSSVLSLPDTSQGSGGDT